LAQKGTNCALPSRLAVLSNAVQGEEDGDESPEAFVTTDQEALREIFRRDGFIQIDGFFDPRDVDEIENNVTRFIRDVVPTLPKSSAMYQVCGEPGTLKQLTNLESDAFFFGYFSAQEFEE
jgi:hypothetical protein